MQYGVNSAPWGCVMWQSWKERIISQMWLHNMSSSLGFFMREAFPLKMSWLKKVKLKKMCLAVSSQFLIPNMNRGQTACYSWGWCCAWAQVLMKLRWASGFLPFDGIPGTLSSHFQGFPPTWTSLTDRKALATQWKCSLQGAPDVIFKRDSVDYGKDIVY